MLIFESRLIFEVKKNYFLASQSRKKLDNVYELFRKHKYVRIRQTVSGSTQLVVFIKILPSELQ